MAVYGQFIGSGFLTLKDTSGNAYPAGVLQDVTLDLDGQIKELVGSYKVALSVAETQKKVSLKAKFAQLSTPLVAAALGGTITTGNRNISTKNKTASGSAFTVATGDDGSPSGWAFVTDLGVTYQATGQPLKYNSGTLASTGEYKNTGGSYTLGSGDATAAVTVSYVWSQTAGEKVTVANQAIGLATVFSVYLFEQSTQPDGTTRKIGWYFPAVILPKLSINFKNDDFATQDLELTVMADSAGNIAEMYSI